MQENPQTHNQNNALKILRRSTHIFLTHIHHFTSTPSFLVLPFSLSLLLHHLSSTSTTTTSTLHHRLQSVLIAAGFPLNSPISHFLLHKLSQTLSSFLFSLPFTFFLILSKSSTLHSLENLENLKKLDYHSKSKLIPLFHTHILNLFVLIAANSAFFTLLILISTIIAETNPIPTWVFVVGSIFYSVVIAHTIVICNIALISSGWEGMGGIPAILRACCLIRDDTTTALLLALPGNLAMAGVELVFWCRIYGGVKERCVWVVAVEAVLIGYMYSNLIVWDTIVGCLFYQSCKEEVFKEDYASDLKKLKALEEGS